MNSWESLKHDLDNPKLRLKLLRIRARIRRGIRRWFVENPRTWYERARYGYSIYDRFSLDDYLSWWLPRALHDLRTAHNGHPFGWPMSVASAEVPEAEGLSAWEAALEAMEEGFIAARRLAGYDFGSAEREVLEQKLEVGLQLFAKHFLDLWD